MTNNDAKKQTYTSWPALPSDHLGKAVFEDLRWIRHFSHSSLFLNKSSINVY